MKKDTLLGTKVGYESKYNPKLLDFVPRLEKRNDIGFKGKPAFKGFDIWNAYEISYLNPQGKPVVRLGTLIYDGHTKNIVESKSLKLYLNSFNMTKFSCDKTVEDTIMKDLKKGLNDRKLSFRLFKPNCLDFKIWPEEHHMNLDIIPIKNPEYKINKDLLTTYTGFRSEQNLKSDLLKSNCLVTHQPDWATVYIRILPEDQSVDEESLLKYIISFREHNEFHEQCVERIYFDLMMLLKPKALEVFAKYTRRGGIDINPYRIYDPTDVFNKKDFRKKMEKVTFHREARQ